MSYRKVAWLGSAMVTTGVGLMPLFPYIPAFCWSFGVLTGIGCCLVYLPSHVLTGLYYKRHQSLATGVATSGSGLGGAIMPVVFGKLIEDYYWRPSLYIVAGLMLNLFVCSALLESPPEENTSPEKEKKNGTVAEPESMALLKQDAAGKARPDQFNESLKQASINNVACSPAEDNGDVESSVDGEAVSNGHAASEVPDKAAKIHLCQEKTKAHTFQEETALEEKQEGGGQKKKILRHIYLFTDFGFDVYFISSILWNSSAAAVMAFGPDFTYSQGISIINSAWLLTLLGFGDFVGAVVGAVVGNVWYKGRVHQYTVACMVFGGCLMAFPLGRTFGEFAAILIFGGLSFGAILGLLVVVLVDLIGTHNLGDGMGYIMLANGIGAFTGPVLTGYIHSTYGSYNLAFYIEGLLGILAGVSMWLIPLANYLFPSSRHSASQGVVTVIEIKCDAPQCSTQLD